LTFYRLVMAVLWTILIMTLCWLPRFVVEAIESESSWLEVPNFDKLVHCGIFVIFAILWARVWSARSRFAWVMLGGFALAAITEVVQQLPTIGRDANLYDAVTDAIGVVIGIAVAPLVEPWARFLESRLFPGSRTQPVAARGAPVTVDGGVPPSH
jgi:hypothetical protein